MSRETNQRKPSHTPSFLPGRRSWCRTPAGCRVRAGRAGHREPRADPCWLRPWPMPREWRSAVLRFAGALVRSRGWRGGRDIVPGGGSGSCVITPHRTGGNYTRKQIREFCWRDVRDWTGGMADGRGRYPTPALSDSEDYAMPESPVSQEHQPLAKGQPRGRLVYAQARVARVAWEQARTVAVSPAVLAMAAGRHLRSR
jgi:hypothetical protein